MMRLYIIITLLFSSTIYAQTLELSVQNKFDESVSGYSVSINSKIVTKEVYDKVFSIDIQPNDSIVIKHKLYESYEFTILNSLKPNDTIRKVVLLTSHLQELDEVVISGEKFSEVYNEKNEFIKDYYPLPSESLLLLKRRGNESQLVLTDLSGEVSFSIVVPNSYHKIVMDAFGNLYMKSKSTYQHIKVVEKRIQLLEELSLEDYTQYLADLIACNDNECVFQSFTAHNKIYLLKSIGEQENLVYHFIDKEQVKIGQDEYRRVINLYLKMVPPERNIILLGEWNGDIMELVDTSSDPDTPANQIGAANARSSWYKNIVSLPLNIQSFGMSENLIILNGENDSIIQIDRNTLKIMRKALSEKALSGEYFQDYFYDNIYMIDDVKGTKQVYKINAATGATQLTVDLSEIYHPRNIKVLNDEVYFLVLDKSGFNRLLKYNQ